APPIISALAVALYATPFVAAYAGLFTDCARLAPALCLESSKSGAPGIFGFAEFVQAFALLVIVYTFTDVKYRFRIAVAPLPILPLTYVAAALVGAGTLFSDFWFANGYPVPSFLNSLAGWQAGFGLLFLVVVLLWIWFAFVAPPRFGR